MGKIRKGSIELPENVDITDYIANGGVIDEKPKQSTNIYRGIKIWETQYEPVEWAIKDMIPMRKKTVAVGDFEAGKSYLYLGAALSIAAGKSGYIGFEIPKKRKVLYVDLENGADETIKRIQKLTKGHELDKHLCAENFSLMTKPGDFDEVFPEIIAETLAFQPDVIIIDNLYQLSGSSNIADADKIKPLLAKIEDLRQTNNSAVVLIHHFNKNTHDQGITEERMAGSSTINWWYEYCTMLVKTNRNFSLYAVGKSRMDQKNPGVYGIEINDAPNDGIEVTRGGLVSTSKISGLLVPEVQKMKWESHLERMSEKFETNEWLNVCGDKDGESVSDITAKRWLKEMVSVGMLKKLSHGIYTKTNMSFYADFD